MFHESLMNTGTIRNSQPEFMATFYLRKSIKGWVCFAQGIATRDVPSRVLGRVLRHFHYSDSAEY